MKLIGDAEMALILGLLLLAVALFMVWGAPAVVAFGGMVLIVLALVMHYGKAQRQAGGDD